MKKEMDRSEDNWSQGCGLPLEKWLWLNRRGAFEDEKLLKHVAPFPPAELMAETDSISEKELFARSGADIYESLHIASPKNLNDFNKILVINCGCGRLLRLFKGHGARIYCCDQNARNIQWIKKALEYVDACQLSPGAPFPFPDDFFDAVVAVSFFTSLADSARNLMLPELKRITSETGSVFISVYGERSLSRARNEPRLRKMLNMEECASEKIFVDFRTKGSVFLSRNLDVDWKDKIKILAADLLRVKSRAFRPGVSFVSKSYVLDKWKRWFDMIDVHEGAVHDFQDLVVMSPGKKDFTCFFSCDTPRDGSGVSAPGKNIEGNPPKASVWIESIKKHEAGAKEFCHFSVDNPSASGDVSGKPFGFSGWIAGKNRKFHSIEIFADGVHILSIPVNIKRPDVADHFKIASGDDEFGFSAYFNPFYLSPRFNIEGFAASPDVEKIKLFSIVGGRTQFADNFRPEMSPLVINTLGRTGSTYMLGLLGAHPQIAVYRPFEVETRYTHYWMQMFLGLGHPKSWVFPVASYNIDDPSWILGDDSGKQLHQALYPEMSAWFNGAYVQQLFGFCMKSLQEHYRQVAGIQRKKNALFFGEKFLPNFFTDAVVNLIPGAKEIVLVRDFRDMFCSIAAFNRKRGFLGFGREKFASDEEYIAKALAPGAKSLYDSWKRRRSDNCLVRYEDLVVDTESNLEKIFGFIGIDAAPSTVGKVIGRAKKMNPKAQKNHKTTSRAKDSLKRYHREMAPDLLALCNEVFEECLVGFGYEV